MPNDIEDDFREMKAKFVEKHEGKMINEKHYYELRLCLIACRSRFEEISKLKTIGKFLPNMSKDMVEYINSILLH